MTTHAVRAARMFDGERLVDGGVTILLNGGRIADVHQGWVEAPEGWPVVDEPDGAVLPGLVDAHVHLCADAGSTRSGGSPTVPRRTSTRSSNRRCLRSWQPESRPFGTWAIGAAPCCGGGTTLVKIMASGGVFTPGTDVTRP